MHRRKIRLRVKRIQVKGESKGNRLKDVLVKRKAIKGDTRRQTVLITILEIRVSER